jgi:hypothetical protein
MDRRDLLKASLAGAAAMGISSGRAAEGRRAMTGRVRLSDIDRSIFWKSADYRA